VWHLKETLLLKTISIGHRSKFSALSPVIVTAAGYLKITQVAINKQNKQTKLLRGIMRFITDKIIYCS
jgi:hypothetical protein